MTSQAKRSRDRLTPSQARAARRARRLRRRRALRVGIFVAVGVIALLFIVSLFAGSLPISIGRTTPAEGPWESVPEQQYGHIDLGESHAPYNSVPATSGPHYGQPLAPVRWGVHDDFVADEYRIHNLEHGGIGVHYDCPEGCPELEQQLADIVRKSVSGGLKVMMSPYPGLDATIALTAWTSIDKFDLFDEQRIEDFILAHESSSNVPEPTAR